MGAARCMPGLGVIDGDREGPRMGSEICSGSLGMVEMPEWPTLEVTPRFKSPWSSILWPLTSSAYSGGVCGGGGPASSSSVSRSMITSSLWVFLGEWTFVSFVGGEFGVGNFDFSAVGDRLRFLYAVRLCRL